MKSLVKARIFFNLKQEDNISFNIPWWSYSKYTKSQITWLGKEGFLMTTNPEQRDSVGQYNDRAGADTGGFPFCQIREF